MSLGEYVALAVVSPFLLYLAARVISSAYFSAKLYYHKRLTEHLTKGDPE